MGDLIILLRDSYPIIFSIASDSAENHIHYELATAMIESYKEESILLEDEATILFGLFPDILHESLIIIDPFTHRPMLNLKIYYQYIDFGKTYLMIRKSQYAHLHQERVGVQ